MPHIRLVNIRFRLDGDERDKKIYDALFEHPDGARNRIIKDALYAYLISEGAGQREKASQVWRPQVSKPVRRDLALRADGPEMREQDAASKLPPVQAEEAAAPEEKSAEGSINTTAREMPLSSNTEEQQVIKGLRSMIL